MENAVESTCPALKIGKLLIVFSKAFRHKCYVQLSTITVCYDITLWQLTNTTSKLSGRDFV